VYAPVFATAIAVFAFALFAQAGLAKVRQPEAYRQPLSEYLGGVVLGAWAPRVIGGLELLAAVAVVLPATRASGGVLCGALLLLYAVAMARLVLRGRVDVRCGCSGPAAETRIAPELIARNLVAALPCASLVLVANAPVTTPALLTGTALGVVLVLAYLSGDQVIANRQRLQGWAS